MKRNSRIIVFVLCLSFVFSLFTFGVQDVNAAEKNSITSKKPKISVKLSENKKSVIITTAKASYAEGFYIYMKKQGDKKFKKVEILSKNGKKKRNITIDDLLYGKYFFKVKAYGKVDGEIVTSKYSKTVSIEISKCDSGKIDSSIVGTYKMISFTVENSGKVKATLIPEKQLSELEKKKVLYGLLKVKDNGEATLRIYIYEQKMNWDESGFIDRYNSKYEYVLKDDVLTIIPFVSGSENLVIKFKKIDYDESKWSNDFPDDEEYQEYYLPRSLDELLLIWPENSRRSTDMTNYGDIISATYIALTNEKVIKDLQKSSKDLKIVFKAGKKKWTHSGSPESFDDEMNKVLGENWEKRFAGKATKIIGDDKDGNIIYDYYIITVFRDGRVERTVKPTKSIPPSDYILDLG
ncbi:MAG: hypothetical protein IKP88_02910 [Lachnospiraceae bacterium]|nr:hypothetical protein [Lachnospiraceae bacterium]